MNDDAVLELFRELFQEHDQRGLAICLRVEAYYHLALNLYSDGQLLPGGYVLN